MILKYISIKTILSSIYTDFDIKDQEIIISCGALIKAFEPGKFNDTDINATQAYGYYYNPLKLNNENQNNANNTNNLDPMIVYDSNKFMEMMKDYGTIFVFKENK